MSRSQSIGFISVAIAFLIMLAYIGYLTATMNDTTMLTEPLYNQIEISPLGLAIGDNLSLIDRTIRLNLSWLMLIVDR